MNSIDICTFCKYNSKMKFEWHEGKNKINIEKHGADFADAHEIFERTMLINQDNRMNYGENRFIGVGYIKSRLMVIIFTRREPNIIRIISLRKANKREQARFEKALKN
jgi:uncharacterized protein